MPKNIFSVVFALNTLLGLVISQSKHPVLSRSARAVVINRRNEAGDVDVNELERIVWELTGKNLSSSAEAEAGVLGRTGGRAGPPADTLSDGSGLSVYYNILNTIFAVYRPLLTRKFMDELPQAVVCILTGRNDCGFQAELTKSISSQINQPMRSLLTSVKTLTCQISPTSRSAQSTDFVSPLLDDSTLTHLSAIQDLLLSALVQLPQYYSDYLVYAWHVFSEATIPPLVKFVSDLMVKFIKTPTDYVKIGLQFGIEIPALNQSEQCQQGDLKQLIIWGMSHNVSWSFGGSMLDIFLAPEPPPCSYPSPECQSTNSIQFSRSLGETSSAPPPLLSCDRRNLTGLNDTLCAELLDSGPGDSPTVHSLCKALSTLTPSEMEQVWLNGCDTIRSLLSPLVNSPGCDESSPLPSVSRVSRSTLSLTELMCNYSSWTVSGFVEPNSVSFCSDNDREQFLQAVCQSTKLMPLLVVDPNNAWLWGFCANFSQGNMVSQYCSYETWKEQMGDPSILSFCWEQDRQRMEKRLCEDLNFFMQVLSDPQNTWVMPNCSGLEPPTQMNMNAQVASTCRYSEWRNPETISRDVLSMCVQHDEQGFVQEVCTNSTFLNTLLKNNLNVWLGDFCTFSLNTPPTDPPVTFSISDWCNYEQWGGLTVDPSVVGLCWQHDQMGFNKNVCCNMPLFEKLTVDPQNEWLFTACADKEPMDMLPQVCRYTDWTRPTIVDMTDLALCAELDTQNFTRQVCSNTTVLQNLLANLDNTWLLQYCSNHSASATGGEGGGSLIGFKPAEQCQYHSWAVALPDPSLLALCWDYDQANFVSTICTDSALLSLLTQEPSSVWVGTLCATYTNYTESVGNGDSNSNVDGNGNSNGDPQSNNTKPHPCLARDLIKRLNWSCSVDFNAACQPGASRLVGLQLLLRCGAEALQPQVGGLLSEQMSSIVDQVVNEAVVLLVALEESQMTSLRVTENIRLSVLDSVMLYLEQETNFSNKRILLQCFGKVLTSLMQTGRDVTSDGFFLIKEYFRIPLVNLRAVLSAVDITTVRQIMQYYSRNLGTLQLSEDYLRTMVSVFFQTHLTRDGNLFPDLAPLLPLVKPMDIMSLPRLQRNANVLNTINTNIQRLSLEQRNAFGKWFGRSISVQNMTAGGPSLIRDTGNLIVYLPFSSFQHLSPAQLLDGLDVLLRNTLSPTQQQYVAQTLFAVYRNLTTDIIKSLGNLTCLAKPKDLQMYRNTEAFAVIQKSVRTCVSLGLKVPSDMVTSLFLNATELQTPSNLSAERISQLADFMPWLGVDFLQQLSASQLRPALPALAAVPFSPAQARVIVDKVLPSSSLELPGQLLQLRSLVSGVKVETLWALTSDSLLAALPDIALHSPGLSPPQANAITTKLWGSKEVIGWLDEVEPLLSKTPLLSVQPRAPLLMANRTSVRTRTWNTQQAKSLFKQALKTTPNLSTEELLALGTVAQGANCDTLQRIFHTQSISSLRNVLAFLREQPVPLHTSLKTCVIEKLYDSDYFAQLLGELGSQIALELPVSTIKKFPSDMMDTLRKMIVQEPKHFLRLPSIKQALLVDKIVQRLNMYTGQYTEAEFRSLGVMATSVVDEMFIQVDRTFFLESLDFLKSFCYSSSKRDMVARILQEPVIFGSVRNWTVETLDQVDRFIFFLPKESLQLIPAGLMTLERIERLFLSQQQWEVGEFGALCMQSVEQSELRQLFERKQFVLQFFLGFLKVGQLSRAASMLVPSCENLHTMLPSAWTVDSLTAMPSGTFSSCLELIGQDPFFMSYELMALLSKVKKIYGTASSFSPSVISQLGRIANLLTEDELSRLNLSDMSTIAALGRVSSWNSRQLPVLFSTVLNSTKMSPSQLDSSTLVALGHIVCGIKVADMQNLNAVEFSKAALWLGSLRLTCSEEQLHALVGLLSHSLAFGPISSWGSEQFIEIGALAAGLPDIAMSALVNEQIEGITPLAVSLIPAEKFAVVFSPAQIRMFSYEQGVAVTAAQRSALTPVQQTALSMVLTPWEDKPVDFRGRSSGLALRPGLFSLLLELLVLLVLTFHSSL